MGVIEKNVNKRRFDLDLIFYLLGVLLYQGNTHILNQILLLQLNYALIFYRHVIQI